MDENTATALSWGQGIIPKPGEISGGHPESAQKCKLASLSKLPQLGSLLINRSLVACQQTWEDPSPGQQLVSWKSHGMNAWLQLPSQHPCKDGVGAGGVLGAAEHQHSVPLTTPPHCFYAFQRLSGAKILTKALLKPVGKQRAGGLWDEDCILHTQRLPHQPIEHKSPQQAYGTEASDLFALPRFPGEEEECKTSVLQLFGKIPRFRGEIMLKGGKGAQGPLGT